MYIYIHIHKLYLKGVCVYMYVCIDVCVCVYSIPERCVCIYISCSANKSAANTSFPSRAELAEAAALKEQQRRSEMAAAEAAAKARREQQAADAAAAAALAEKQRQERVALAREQAQTLSQALSLSVRSLGTPSLSRARALSRSLMHSLSRYLALAREQSHRAATAREDAQQSALPYSDVC